METYIVRIWNGDHEAAQGTLRGIVRQVRSGRELGFVSWAELLPLLASPGSWEDDARGTDQPGSDAAMQPRHKGAP